MAVDLHGSDPLFNQPGKRPGEHVEALMEYAREQMGLGPDRPWSLVSSRMKLKKTFFEIDENGRRIIGKVSVSGRGKDTFAILKSLWDAGLRPPNVYTVVEPVAFFPEKQLLLQAKAEGLQVVELIRARSGEALGAVEQAAMWLHSLQALPLPLRGASDHADVVERCRAEFIEVLPEHGAAIERLADECARGLADAQPPVPSHGDFHPMNVYVAPGRVTVIDLDTFAGAEPAVDVAYFVAQTAIMGYHVFDSFAATRELRKQFLACAPRVPADRVEVLIRFALLRSLHYDLCILHNGNTAQVEPFLRAAHDGFDV